MTFIYLLFSDLQMTDVELDEQVTALEENGGGGDLANGKVILLFPNLMKGNVTSLSVCSYRVPKDINHKEPSPQPHFPGP